MSADVTKVNSMKIKSITDVITNSSNEVFCYKIDSFEYKKFKELIPEVQFIEFKTWEDIRNYVTNKDYFEWDLTKWAQCTHGEGAIEPKNDFYGDYTRMQILKESGKTDDEIWEFFKSGYENILGLAYYSIEEGESYPKWMNKYWNWITEKYLKETKEFLESNFKEGDILAIPFTNSLSSIYTLPVLITYSNKELKNPYVEQATPEVRFKNYFIAALDTKKARLATPEEINKYKKAYEDKINE